MQRNLPKHIFSVIICTLLVLFTGCGRSTPKQDSDGVPWEDSWIRIGNYIGIEKVPDIFTLSDSKDVLAPQGLYYASWTAGESRPYTNDEDKEIPLFDAQLYMVVSERDSEEEASESLDEWISAARASYDVASEEERGINGQSFQILTYTCHPETSPYDRGISAFTVYGSCAVCAELTCLEETDLPLDTLLSEFLKGFHYA